MVTTIIFAGGLGTRLYPITEHTPKPLVFYKGAPLIEHTIEFFKRVSDKMIVVGCHMSSHIIEYLSYKYPQIHTLIDPYVMDTGGSLQYHWNKIREQFNLTGEHIIFTVADHIRDFDPLLLRDVHVGSRNEVTFLVGEPQAENNTLTLDEHNNVSEFRTKEEYGHKSDASSIGEFLMKAEFVDQNINRFNVTHIEYDFLKSCIQHNIATAKAFFVDFWKDLGYLSSFK